MKVSASFLSSRDVVRDLIKLNETDVDYIHVDIMDGKFVANKTMPFSEMKNIYKYTSKRLDVHLMVEDPKSYIPLYASLNTEYITFHVEVDEDIDEAEKAETISYLDEEMNDFAKSVNMNTSLKIYRSSLRVSGVKKLRGLLWSISCFVF